jgi:Mlc titration factor MtfA (ptsG expression regulator)
MSSQHTSDLVILAPEVPGIPLRSAFHRWQVIKSWKLHNFHKRGNPVTSTKSLVQAYGCTKIMEVLSMY